MTNLTVHQITLVDETGQPKLRLSATSGTPTIELLGKSGEVALTVALDATGHPAITLNNPDDQLRVARGRSKRRPCQIRPTRRGLKLPFSQR